EAQELIDYAGASGAKALVLVPKNDGAGCADGDRQANLRQALTALKPMLGVDRDDRHAMAGSRLPDNLGFGAIKDGIAGKV
ncbi:hypothetical protein AB9F34_34355, partial [Rhizobium leguminosarum]